MSVLDFDAILESIKRGNDKAFAQVYKENRIPFLNFATAAGISLEEANDVYHESILALRENIISGKLTTLKCTLKTYLFAIGKNKIRELQRRSKPFVSTEKIVIEETNEELDVDFFDQEIINKQRAFARALKKLGQRCQEVLTLFYVEGYSLDEIALILKYSKKNVLKSQKSRCFKQLKDLIR